MRKSNPSQASAASWQASEKRGQPLKGCWRLRSVDRVADGPWPASHTSLASQQPRPLWSAGTIWSQPWVSSPWERQGEETQADLGGGEGVGREAEKNSRPPPQGGCLPHSLGQPGLGMMRRGRQSWGQGPSATEKGWEPKDGDNWVVGRKKSMKAIVALCSGNLHVILRSKCV